MSDEPVEVSIALPLPIDITATLINIIGLTYPGAAFKEGRGGGYGGNRLVLSIPAQDRHKSAKKAEKYQRAKVHLDAETEAFISELRPDAVGSGLPEHLAQMFVAMAKTWFDAYPDAQNYLESMVYDRETRRSWVFTVARSQEQTPHELRRRAEAERDALAAEVQRLREQLGLSDD